MLWMVWFSRSCWCTRCADGGSRLWQYHVYRSTIEDGMAWMREEWGSWAGYAAAVGFGEGEVAALRSALLEPATRPSL